MTRSRCDVAQALDAGDRPMILQGLDRRDGLDVQIVPRFCSDFVGCYGKRNLVQICTRFEAMFLGTCFVGFLNSTRLSNGLFDAFER